MPSGLKTPVEGANLSDEDEASARRRRPSPGFRPPTPTPSGDAVGEIQAWTVARPCALPRAPPGIGGLSPESRDPRGR